MCEKQPTSQASQPDNVLQVSLQLSHLTTAIMTPDDIIATLNMKPHPEGGWYAETWRGSEQPRPAGTAIYFLLEAHQSSHWHRVDAVEIWHWYGGGILELHIAKGSDTQIVLLGPNLLDGQQPQVIVPKDAWQKSDTTEQLGTRRLYCIARI